jgi:hypothetical protein
MAKRKNSGIVKQDNVIRQFHRDARSNNDTCAVMQCMRKTPAGVKAEPIRMSFRVLFDAKKA